MLSPENTLTRKRDYNSFKENLTTFQFGFQSTSKKKCKKSHIFFKDKEKNCSIWLSDNNIPQSVTIIHPSENKIEKYTTQIRFIETII